MADKRALLHVAEHDHYLAAVLLAASSAPTIDLPLKDINPDAGNFKVTYSPPLESTGTNATSVIVLKQEAGYTVLYGAHFVQAARLADKTTMRAKLISKPALKRCRVPEEINPADLAVSQPALNERPRYGNDRKPQRSFDQGEHRTPYGTTHRYGQPKRFGNDRGGSSS